MKNQLNHFVSTACIFGTIAMALGTALLFYHTVETYSVKKATIQYLPNGTGWVRFPDGHDDWYYKGDGRQIETRPTDEG